MKKMHKQFFSLLQKTLVAFVITGLIAGSLPFSVLVAFASEESVTETAAASEDVVAAPDRGDSLSPSDTTSDTSGVVTSGEVSDTSILSTSNRGGSRGSSRSHKRAANAPVVPLMLSSEIPDFQSLPTYGEIINTVQINDLTEGGPALAQSDSYARSIANIGDLNGDGVTDIASGAYNGGVNNEGELHISFLNTDGSVLSTATIGDGKGNGPVLADSDHYGSAVTGLGDLNGDGVIDIAVAAYYDDSSGAGQGAVYIHFMNADGTVKSTKKINGNTNGVVLHDEDHYGGSMANIGDLDNDGVTDLAVAAHYYDTNGDDRGAVFIHFLKTDGTIKSTKIIDDATANGPVLADNDVFGTGIAGMGDMNEDGVLDIAVGSYAADVNSAQNSGTVYILYLNTNGTVKDTFAVNAATTNGPVLSAFDYFGRSVANAGDLDSDGYNDLLVGANYDDTTGENKGAVYLVYMWGQSVRATVKIDNTTPNGPELLNNDGRYGMSVANMGDLNNDGVVDIAVGERLSDVGGLDKGALHIHFLKAQENLSAPDMFVYSTAEINDATDNGPVLADEDFYGVGAENIGDVNGDGVNDIAVGANYADHAFTNDGAVFISFLNADGSVISTTEIGSSVFNGPVAYGNSSNYGITVESIGDWDNDGTPDIAVGQRYADVGGINDGAVYLHMLNPDASIKQTIQLSGLTPNGATLLPGEHYGNGIGLIADMDGDGVDELAVAADNASVAGDETGKVFLHFMKQTGEIKFTKVLSKLTTNGPTSLKPGDRYGVEIEDMGDLDNDGVSDIAVGAAYHDSIVQATGAIFIHYMTNIGDVKSTKKITGGMSQGPLLSWEDFFGVGFDLVGDYDNDGIREIAVGANYDDAGGVNKGAVHVLFLDSNENVKFVRELNDLTPNGPVIVNSGARYGSEVANMGDMNGDGFVDILVSEYKNDTNGTDRGAVHIHYLGPVDGISGNAGFTVDPTSLQVSDVSPTATSSVVLTDAPNSTVVFSVTSSDTNLVTVDPAQLTFTNTNWNVGQDITITKTGNDVLVPTIVEITISVVDELSDDQFDTLADQKIFVTILPDTNGGGNDADFAVSPTSLTVAENGGADTFAVVLTKAPATNVVLSITSSNTSDATVNPETLTFTPENWNAAQIVTVTGVDDSINANDAVVITVSVVDASSDDMYDVLADKTVSVSLTNDDSDNGDGGNGGGGGGGSNQKRCHDKNAVNYKSGGKNAPETCQYGEILGAATLSCEVSPYLTKPIKLGANNNVSDVILLEQFLNTYEGTNLPVDGFYSVADFNAVIAWQEKYASEILAPWGINVGTGYVFMTSLQKIKQTHAAGCIDAIQETQILSCALPLIVPTQQVSQGAANDTGQVKLIEKYLNTYESASVLVDGFYSAEDAAKISAWQQKNGIKDISGTVGPPSLAKMKQRHQAQCALFVAPPEF